MPSQRAAGLAPAAPRPGVAGVEFHGPAEVGDRLGVAAQEPARLAAAGVQDRRAGVGLDGPAVLTQRALVLPGHPPGLGRGQGRLRRGGQPAAPLGDLTGQRHPALSLVQGGGQRRGLLHQLAAGREVPLPQGDVERGAGRVVQVGLAAGSPGRRHCRVGGLAGCVDGTAGGPGPGGQPPGAGGRRVASAVGELHGGLGVPAGGRAVPLVQSRPAQVVAGHDAVDDLRGRVGQYRLEVGGGRGGLAVVGQHRAQAVAVAGGAEARGARREHRHGLLGQAERSGSVAERGVDLRALHQHGRPPVLVTGRGQPGVSAVSSTFSSSRSGIRPCIRPLKTNSR